MNVILRRKVNSKKYFCKFLKQKNDKNIEN